MLEIIKILGLIWDFYESKNIIMRIAKTITHYSKFIYWYFKNPKVKMKYSRLLLISDDYKNSLKKIKSLLTTGDYEFTDGIIQQENRLIFEFKDSRLGYQIRGFPLKQDTHHLKISTIFYNVFPFREIGTINEIKTDFYKLCDLVSKTGLKVGNKNESIILEVEIGHKKKIKSNFRFKKNNITFVDNKIQIDNTYGTEFTQLILFILSKWLIEKD